MHVRDPIIELHETDLYQALDCIDTEYASRITQFVTAIAPILATTERYFPYYTRHDAHHGFRVVGRMAQVITPSCLQDHGPAALTSAQLFLLIAAAYAHDLGMTVFPDEADRVRHALKLDTSAGWETSPVLQTHLRNNHSTRGGKFIRDNAEALGVPVNLLGPLDMMMMSHNFSIAQLDGLKNVYAAQERPLDVRQLATIVCVADALEFSDTRVMDGVLARLKIDPSDSARISYRENMKHIGIGDSLAVDSHGRVVVSGAFSEEGVLALAHQTLDQMEEWIQGYCDIDRRSELPRLRVQPEPFLRNLQFNDGQFERLGVRLNKKNVIDLIASNAIWRSNAGIVVRELVQNAVEACRYRAHLSAAADRYHPAVRVDFDRAGRTVTVSDNGCGMSERTVLNHFLTVGSSRSKEAGYVDEDYAPIARFGVGFWSAFTIAHQAQIETAAFEAYRGSPAQAAQASGIAFEVSLEELKDYTIFRPLTRPCGTQVSLRLRDDVAFDDIVMQGRQMLLCTEIPVSIFVDGDEWLVPEQVPDVGEADILGSRTRLIADLDVRIFRWRGEQGRTELTLGLAYRMVDGRATFLADATSSLQAVMGHISFPRTSVCGFSVPVRPDPLCLDLNRVGTFFANHRTPRGFEFAIDRQQLLSNAASAQFAGDITDLVHAGYRAFLAETNALHAPTIAALREQAQMQGGNVYDQFTGPELHQAAERYPDLLCFRLLPVTPTRGFHDTEPAIVNLTELQRLTGSVYTLQKSANLRIDNTRAYRFAAEHPQALEALYAGVQRWIAGGSAVLPAYIIQADRLGSMLFDADAESSVRVLDHPPFGGLCVQTMSLARVAFHAAPANILADVRGRWSGTLYLRTFETPDDKPYLFLGRYRVLIERSSALAQYLRDLVDAGTFTRVADTIALLQEDEEGYTPEAVRHLL